MTRMASMENVDLGSLEALSGKVVGDVASALGLLMAYLGDRAGVFDALADAGRVSVDQLASRTGLHPKYLREWLGSVCAAGYVTFHPDDESFSLSPEQELVMGREGNPACMQGFVEVVISQMGSYESAVQTFMSGEGRPWSDHLPCCFCGTERFFRNGYRMHLVESWLPKLTGVEDRLKSGAKVADIGCGHGASTLLMAQAFPNSQFFGFDFHVPSIDKARTHAREGGLTNVQFEVAGATDYPGNDYDLACMFDALHDMGDPEGAARHLKQSLAENGVFMLVEPLAGDSMQENLHPLGQIYYAASTTICTPASLAQDVGLGLGAQAGQARLTQLLMAAGFQDVVRVAETQTNMVLQAT